MPGRTIRIDEDASRSRRPVHRPAPRQQRSAARGSATLAVSGGSTAPPMLAALATADLPWDRIGVWQVDERVAPDGHPDRNANHLDDFPGRHHLMPVTAADLDRACRRYAAGLPARFDVVDLGMGADGHTASWPPGDPVIDSERPVDLSDEYQGRVRMTLTPAVVNAAAGRVVLDHRRRQGASRGRLAGTAPRTCPSLAFAGPTPSSCWTPPPPAASTPNVDTDGRHHGDASSGRRSSPRRRPPHLAELFAADPSRAERYLLEVGDLRIDYAKQRVDDAVLAALLDVAAAAGVTERRDAMFAGEPINVTERRPALHVALRAPRRTSRSSSTATTSSPTSTRCSTVRAPSPSRSATGRGRERRASASAPSSTSASAAPISAPPSRTRP